MRFEVYFLILLQILMCQASVIPMSVTCRVDVNRNLGEIQPLLVVPGKSQFVRPTNSRGQIILNRGEIIEVFCSHGFSSPYTNQKSILLSCDTRSAFLFNGRKHEFSEINCNQFPTHVARRIRSKACYRNSTEVEIGFDIGDRFLQVMTLCHDEILETTYYVKHSMIPANSAFQRSVARISFIQGDFFGSKNISSLFSRSTQRNTIGSILRSSSLARQYIHNTGDMFLARGHLAARADFIFGNQQLSTFHYVNACPQWQYFNGYNWEAVESSVRTLVGAQNINLEIYTGTHGIATLNDIRGNPQEIFLYVDGNVKKIPVPRYYYKILINKETSSGIVLIGINNPHLTIDDIKKEYILCNDVSDKITYINWKRDNIQYGYSYACDVNEFLKVVPHVTITNINKLLIF